MDMKEATRKLDRVQARKQPVPAKLRGVPVTVVPEPGNMFRILLSMANGNAMAAARRLNDATCDVQPWPPQGHCEARASWDTMLHYLTMTDDVVFE